MEKHQRSSQFVMPQIAKFNNGLWKLRHTFSFIDSVCLPDKVLVVFLPRVSFSLSQHKLMNERGHESFSPSNQKARKISFIKFQVRVLFNAWPFKRTLTNTPKAPNFPHYVKALSWLGSPSRRIEQSHRTGLCM